MSVFDIAMIGCAAVVFGYDYPDISSVAVALFTVSLFFILRGIWIS